MQAYQIVIILIIMALCIIGICYLSTNSREEVKPEEPEFLDIPEDHVYTIEDKEYYTEETITRTILIKYLTENGATGISKLKKSELIERMYEMHLNFPEVKHE